MRSNTAGGKPGEQCCYDKDGKLITGGTGAGTADKASPGSGFSDTWENLFFDSGHQDQDVSPADDAIRADGGQSSPHNDKYKELRPVNNKNNCTPNVVNG